MVLSRRIPVLFILTLLGLETAAYAAEPVEPTIKLLMNINVPMAHYGIPWQISQTRVLVKNLAYEKKVTVVFDEDGKKTESAGRYFGPAEGGYEVWEAYSNVGAGVQSFHVEYAVDGKTFGIDNAGQNFALPTGAVLYAGQAVQQLLTGKEFYGEYASITAAVKSDIGPDKTVKLHYSFDAFASEGEVVNLSFRPYYTYGYGVVNSPSDTGTELWSASILDLPSDVKAIHYYLTVDSEGQHFEDRNFGRNYIMRRAAETY